MKIANKILYTFEYTLITISILAITVFILSYNYNQYSILGIKIRGASNQLGVIGLVVGIAAISLWISRRALIHIKKRKRNDFGVINQSIMLLKKHHIIFGWLTIFTSTAHGIYYLLEYPRHYSEIFTGILAWFTLIILSLIGAVLDYKIKEKEGQKRVRIYHIILGFIFIIGLMIHII